MAIHTAPKMIVEPKSGCFISRKATAPVTSADIGKMGSDLSASRRLRSQARATTKKGFKNSDGCSWPIPMSIQRVAPFTSGPSTGTKMSRTKKKLAPASDRRLARSRLIIEIPIITGIPTAIQTICR